MRGFSTLEILIAMAIMVSTMTAVVSVSFGSQSMLATGEASAGAVEKAQILLETLQAHARKDFRLLNQITHATSGVYSTSLAISSVSSDPYRIKRATATVSWDDIVHTTRSVSLTTLVSNWSNASTTDTCDSHLYGDWMHPRIDNYSLSRGNMLPNTPPVGHTFSTGGTISTVDAYHHALYVALSKKTVAGDDSLFVFDISNPTASPVYLASSNNNASVTEGLNAIVVASNYVYGANGHVSNFKTCKPSRNCSQLQIFDMSNSTVIPPPINFLIPTSSVPFVTGTTSTQALGSALFYNDGYIYLGLSKTATGPEFNILDVHDPAHVEWIGGYKIGNSIDQIYIRDGYAYLATDDKSRELIVLDVHDPAHPQIASTFDQSGTLGYEVGKSIYTRGDVVFTGMSFAFGSPELYVLDIAHPFAPLLISSKIVGGTIMGMFARDSLLFLLTSTMQQFHTLDISDISHMAPYTTPLSIPGVGASLDCEGNYFFVGSNTTTAPAHISIIGPAL